MRADYEEKKVRGNCRLTGALLFFAVIFMVSAGILSDYYWNSAKEGESFENLREHKKNQTSSLGRESGEEEILPQYAELSDLNADFFGWVSIEGTEIDYPVMLSLEEPEFYLTHSFDGNPSKCGVPFLGAGYQKGGANCYLYGHNMKNGTMFAALTQYKKEEFYLKHRIIRFDTRYEEGRYEVIAAFETEAEQGAAELDFDYQNFGDISTAEEFNEYVTHCRELTPYQIEGGAEYGDLLLTLSTCSYHAREGRFVVVAKKIK